MGTFHSGLPIDPVLDLLHLALLAVKPMPELWLHRLMPF